jgi:hypothetical protein
MTLSRKKKETGNGNKNSIPFLSCFKTLAFYLVDYILLLCMLPKWLYSCLDEFLPASLPSSQEGLNKTEQPSCVG